MLNEYTQFCQAVINSVPELGPSFKETIQEEALVEALEMTPTEASTTTPVESLPTTPKEASTIAPVEALTVALTKPKED